MDTSNYKRLGDYIELVQERNKDMSVTKLMGVSVLKTMMPSIANIIGTDLSCYRVASANDFVYIADTSRRGDKIAIAKNNLDEKIIVSQAYTVFRITNTKELDPEYLMMWVMRPEFDRYARFHSHGSVREIFSWEEMCDVMLPIPDIVEQKRIVSKYQTIEKRIENNNRLIQKLEDTAKALYHHTFVENIDPENLPEGWKKKSLFETSNVIYGFPFNAELFTDNENLNPVVRIRDISCNQTTTYTNEEVEIKYQIANGDILIGMDGNFHMSIWSGGFALQNQRIVRLYPKDKKMLSVLQIFYSIKPIIEVLEKTIEGTTVSHLSDKDIKSIHMLVAPDKIQEEITLTFIPIEKSIIIANQENLILQKYLSLMLAKFA